VRRGMDAFRSDCFVNSNEPKDRQTMHTALRVHSKHTEPRKSAYEGRSDSIDSESALSPSTMPCGHDTRFFPFWLLDWPSVRSK
jgi:hypothetical protein